MEKFLGYRCSLCSSEYDSKNSIYTCPIDGGNLDIILDYEAIKKTFKPDNFINTQDSSIWRYLPLIPVADPGFNETPFHAAGWTPTFKSESLALKSGLKNLWIKDESKNPTASFKDRASAVVVARAREISAEVVVTASTGNAGAALAGMAAAVGQEAVIFAPRDSPPAKIAQLLVYGAQVLLVDGSYDDAFDLTIQASEEFGWYCRNTGYNPFTAEGKKTAAYEIWEWGLERGIWRETAGDQLAVFVSVGDGNIISGIHKGFKDLITLGWLDKIPRIYGVQSEGSSSIANAYFTGEENIVPVASDTIADSISVDFPRDGVRALRAARETGGAYITVSDEEILDAIAALGKVGIFAEPAGATSYAGVAKAIQTSLINPDTPTIAINTGSGLKDIRAAIQSVPEAPIIEPTINAVRKVIE